LSNVSWQQVSTSKSSSGHTEAY